MICAVLTATAAGCGGDGGRAGGPVTLSMWARSDQAGFMDTVVEAFNREHPDVRVELTLLPSGNYVQKLGVAVASGAGPDLASIDLVYVPFFASSGVLADITDRAAGLAELGRLSRTHLDQGLYENRRYALPFTGDASVMFYNKDLFRRAGLDPERPPGTWEEFLDAARRISGLGEDYHGYHFSGRCGGCNIFTLAPFVWAAGGQVVEGEAGAERPVVGEDPAVAQALELYRTMWREGLMTPQSAADTGAQALTLFGGGRVGMYATGSFAVDEIHTTYPDLDFGVTPIPGPEGGGSSFAGGDDIAITSDSDHQDAAWTFLSWAVSPRTQQMISESGPVPVHTDVALGAYSERGPEYAALAQALVNGRTVRSVQENALFNAGTSPWATMIAQSVFGEDPDSVAHAVAQAQDDMANILSRG
ncbi:ABC transporter substrate-binding protein [Streptomyces hoynatensis]|uniref:Sugar ABC transporter substrate-binding protein n=1 Tax=Streptomyces hoynatensis TaxID=1141874 RepID=A0A3A9YL74_9ACTN|nr:sugar ABC transporter substrate-binding protein [Streptomyces hoynatensis]RKN37173.1 sugar ABC transporter substrate-binding protein [Streptomyces hoynatensis]